jgi:hypothetical protein
MIVRASSVRPITRAPALANAPRPERPGARRLIVGRCEKPAKWEQISRGNLASWGSRCQIDGAPRPAAARGPATRISTRVTGPGRPQGRPSLQAWHTTGRGPWFDAAAQPSRR